MIILPFEGGASYAMVELLLYQLFTDCASLLFCFDMESKLRKFRRPKNFKKVFLFDMVSL